MKHYLLYFPFLFCLFFFISAKGQCPASGNATSQKEQQLNRGKNRNVVPPSTSPEILPLNRLINSGRREDQNLYRNGAYVQTEGYLISAEEQGPESCNCGLARKAQKNGDVHIYIGLVPGAPKKNCIVVEITPAYKKIHPDYKNTLVLNGRVKISGFLLYDYLHRGNAVNTCTGCGHVWRKTCWEIHPVLRIQPI